MTRRGPACFIFADRADRADRDKPLAPVSPTENSVRPELVEGGVGVLRRRQPCAQDKRGCSYDHLKGASATCPVDLPPSELLRIATLPCRRRRNILWPRRDLPP